MTPLTLLTKFDLFIEKHLGDKAMNLFMGISLVLSLVLSISLFFLLPNFVVTIIDKYLITLNRFFYNLIEGLVRICIFILYMFAVSKMKDIRRVFMYHGAEHKTIHAMSTATNLP